MRCNNCGWDNPSGQTRCEKCNAPLESEVHTPQAPVERPASPNIPRIRRCPVCDYPLRPNVWKCPNCKWDDEMWQNQETIGWMREEYHKRRNNAATPQDSDGTINPWVQVAQPNKCHLEPVPQVGVDTPEKVVLKGDKHELNRATLDPDNYTITSKVQAEITCRDGKWFIEDKSAQQTTFIHVSSATELKDGDVILMGNRQFIFKTDK